VAQTPTGSGGIKIYIAAKQPAATVSHRGYWFYIDDTDMRTKLFYKTVR